MTHEIALVKLATKETLDWLEVQMTLKVVWKSVLAMSGVLCVMMNGILKILL